MKRKLKSFTYLIVCMFALITVFKVNAVNYTTLKQSENFTESQKATLKGNTFSKNGGPNIYYKTTSDGTLAMCTTFRRESNDTTATCKKMTSGWSTDDVAASGIAAIIKEGFTNTGYGSDKKTQYYYTELAINKFIMSYEDGKYKSKKYHSFSNTTFNKVSSTVNKLKTVGAKAANDLKYGKYSVNLGKFNCAVDSDNNQYNCTAIVKTAYTVGSGNKKRNITNSYTENFDKVNVTMNGTTLSSTASPDKIYYTSDYNKSTKKLTVKVMNIDNLKNGETKFNVNLTMNANMTYYLAQEYYCDSKYTSIDNIKNQNITLNKVKEASNKKSSNDNSSFSIQTTTSGNVKTYVVGAECNLRLKKYSISGEPIIPIDDKRATFIGSKHPGQGPIELSAGANENMTCINSEIGEVFIEDQVPTGYTKTEKKITKDDMDAGIAIIEDTPDTALTIKKVDGTDNSKLLNGATIILRDSDGEQLTWDYDSSGNAIVNTEGKGAYKEWVSDSKGITFKGLLYESQYEIEEISAPEGYNITNPQEFVTLKNQDGQREKTVEFKNYKSFVTISKQDMTNKKELAGAKLQVVTGQGNVVDEWISTNEPHEIKGLGDGTYYLVEISAPDGYELNTEKMEFTMEKGKSTTDEVVMYNSPKKVNVPNTFSAKNIITYVVGGLLIAFGTGVLVYELKKKKA